MTTNEFLAKLPEFLENAGLLCETVCPDKARLQTDLKLIEDLDDVVEKVHNLFLKGLIDDTAAWNSSVALGSLLGEMIINEHEFHWTINSDDVPVVEKREGYQLSPITKIYKIITSDVDGGEGSPSSFYQGFLALTKLDSMTEEERERITTYVESDSED